MTLAELLKDSLALIGVTNITPAKNAQAIRFLNNMTASISTETLKIYAVISESFSLVAGTSEYTLGTGGDFNTARPDRIMDAYLSDGGSDYLLTEIPKATYNDIFNKGNDGRPSFYVFLKEYPLAKLLFYVEPDDTYTVNFDSTKVLTSFSMALLTTTVVIPANYLEFLVYNLAIRLAPIYSMKISAEVASIAGSSARNIENLNSTPVKVIAPEAGLETDPGVRDNDWKSECP